MAGTLVDSNVILDVFTEDDEWMDWSAAMLADAADAGALYINPIIYAEVSLRFERIEDLDDALPAHYYRRAQLPWEAGFLAAKAFAQYRRPIIAAKVVTFVARPSRTSWLTLDRGIDRRGRQPSSTSSCGVSCGRAWRRSPSGTPSADAR